MILETLLIYGITIIISIITTLYIYFKYKYTYWKKEKVPFINPTFPFGNVKSILLLTDSLGDCFKNIYLYTKSKTNSFGGFYQFSKPAIMVIDPEIVKNMLTKDFTHFQDRNFFIDEDADPLSAHLVALKGNRWKNSRAKLTPTFTSGKMKMMFHTMVESSKGLIDLIDKHIEENQLLDTRDVFGRLSTDIIASCAFGLDCNSLKDPNVVFRKYGLKIFEFHFRDALINMLAVSCPSILKLFKIPQTPPDITEFFMGVLKQTVDYREKNNIRRKDFMDLLIRLKNNQSVLDDQLESKETTEGISFNELAAHAFVFFAAGFETTSTTMNFCLFELTSSPEIQEKVRKEVVEVLGKHNNELTYEAVMEMKYMDKVFNEVLRKYPPIPVLNRECTEDYKVPGSNYVIKKGTEVIISTLGMQHDSEHFPDPNKFDPERFSEEQKAKRHPYTYLPFGEGPRACIGLRFSLLQLKIILTTLLKKYRFTLDPKTVSPVKFTPTSIFLTPKDIIWIKAHKLT